MRSIRFALALAAVSISAMSHAYLLQEWTKTIVTGSTNYANDVAIDNAGNVYVLGSANDLTKSLFVTKIGPTGTTLWTKTYSSPAGTIRGFDIAVDGSGSIYFAFDTLQQQVNFRKLRGSDGATLGDLLVPLSVPFSDNRMCEILFDENGQMYLALMSTGFLTGAPTLAVYNINLGAVASSTARSMTLGQETRMLQAKARPGGGIIVLAGIEVDASKDNFISNIYSFGPSGSPKITSVGYATAFAVDPVTDDIHTIGGRGASFNRIYRQIAPLDQGPVDGQNNSTDFRSVFIRDLLVTKNGTAMAAGGYLEEPDQDYLDSAYFRYPVTANFITGSFTATTSGNYQQAETIQSDNFGNITVAEYVTATQIRIVELDAAYSGFIHTRSYSLPTNGPDVCHAVNGAGLVAVASGDRVVVLKPRDLKDIYMGSTTIKGGLSATAIIRMYEPHTVQRIVNLSDDNAANVTIAASKVILANQTQVSATVITKAVTSNQVTTLSAKYGNQTRTFTFTVVP